MSRTVDYKKYVEYAKTDREIEIINLLASGKTQNEVADIVGLSRRSVRNYYEMAKSRAAQHGYDPEHDLTHDAGKDFLVDGVSSYYKNPNPKEGEPSGQWVKTKRDKAELLELTKRTIEAFCREVPRAPKIKKEKGKVQKDKLVVIPMGDPHLGMMAWGEETGDNHNLEIGIRDLITGVERVVESTPRCGECLIINTGDFFHSDLMTNQTLRSGHNLDVDGRWMKIHDAGVNTIRACIEAALRRHEKVTVINAIGNHDDHSAMMLSICLKNVYENNPRVTINASPKNIYHHRFGNNLIGVHHGHEIKIDKLPLTMANEWPKDWGETEFRVWYTGHVHHDSVKEFAGCVVETVRTLAGRDAYASSHGYYAQRDLKAIVHDKVYGPEERHIIPIKKIRDIQKGKI